MIRKREDVRMFISLNVVLFISMPPETTTQNNDEAIRKDLAGEIDEVTETELSNEVLDIVPSKEVEELEGKESA